MSDQNLKNDRFFNKTIKSSPNRRIPIDIIMNCKRIKALEATMEEVIETIEKSIHLDIDIENKLFGRKNHNLPLLREKKFYVTMKNDYKKSEDEIRHAENFIIFRPFIVGFISDKKIFLKDKELMKKTARYLGFDVPFAKASKKKGVFIFNENSDDKEKIEEFSTKDCIEI